MHAGISISTKHETRSTRHETRNTKSYGWSCITSDHSRNSFKKSRPEPDSQTPRLPNEPESHRSHLTTRISHLRISSQASHPMADDPRPGAVRTCSLWLRRFYRGLWVVQDCSKCTRSGTQRRGTPKRNPEEEHLTCGSSHVCVSGILKFLTNYSVV